MTPLAYKQGQTERVARTFVNFPTQTVDRLCNGLEARFGSSPRPSSLALNVLILPLVRTGKGQFVGGVHARPELRNLSIMRGNTPVVTPASQSGGIFEQVDEAWFGGIFFNHFGHFLLEGLARLSREVIASPLPIVFYNPQRLSSIPTYAAAILTGIGISPERIQFVDQPLKVARLYYVSAWFEIRRHINVHDMDWLFQTSTPAYPEYEDRIVYLSRSRLEGRREIASETPLEDAVTTAGGIVCFPERLSVPEQIALLRGCSAVAGAEGSALHTCILAGQPKKRVVICDGAPNLNFLLQDEILGGETVYLDRSTWDIDQVVMEMLAHLRA